MSGTSWTMETGDCREALRALPADSAHAVVTDPPYEIGLMGRAWDRSGVSFDPATWAAVLRVARPGAYLLAFGGTRTFHRQACAIEDAGWELQDTLSWIYGSGFPKHRSKLKPAWEPITLARKPAKQATPLNIDACRIPVHDGAYARNASGDRGHAGTRSVVAVGATDLRAGGGSAHEDGRWPANVILDDDAAVLLDAQSGPCGAAAPASGQTHRGRSKSGSMAGAFSGMGDRAPAFHADAGGASRFFYCPKVSRAERNAGLDGFAETPLFWSAGTQNPGTFQSDGTHKAARNPHPTLKPIALLRWLVRLITPPGGLVLDPFAGAGSTGCAAVLERARFHGIELDAAFRGIGAARIAYWANKTGGQSGSAQEGLTSAL